MSARVELVVGLGNPGPKYEDTRHNAGFWFADAVASAYQGTFRSEPKFNADVAKVHIAGKDLWLLKPQTYMNHSGQPVGALARFYKLAPENILVVHDELDLDAGTARLKKGGGHGGHNGLRDIVGHLGSRDFLRLRLGIAHPGDSKDVVDYVLIRPSKADRLLIDDAIRDALEVLPQVVEGELERAMNQLHSTK